MNNTCPAFWDCLWERPCRDYTWVRRVSSPKPFAGLRGQEGHAKGWDGCLLRSTVELDSSPKQTISFCSNWEQGKLTPRISCASTTLCQSQSDSLNADQGICLTKRLLVRNIVIGPYISSVDVMNTPIGCYSNQIGRINKEHETIRLTWRSLWAWSSILKAVPHQMLLCKGIFNSSGIPQRSWVLWKYSMHCPDAWI